MPKIDHEQPRYNPQFPPGLGSWRKPIDRGKSDEPEQNLNPVAPSNSPTEESGHLIELLPATESTRALEGIVLPTFAERIREHRESLGMSQRALSKRAGLNHSYIQKLERGGRIVPKAQTVLSIIDGLGFNADHWRSDPRIIELVELAGHNHIILIRYGQGLILSTPVFSPAPRLPRFTNGL